MTWYAYGEGQGGADHEMMDNPALSTSRPARRYLFNEDLVLLEYSNITGVLPAMRSEV